MQVILPTRTPLHFSTGAHFSTAQNIYLTMTEAGPSNPRKQRKGGKPKDPKLKSKKAKKLQEARAIAELDQAALSFVRVYPVSRLPNLIG